MTVEPPLRVLMVCAANQCRSPLAEHLLRAALAARSVAWTVSSAGVSAQPGHPVYPSVQRVLAARGIDAGASVSRPITAELVQDADLILTAEIEHRATIVWWFPGAVQRTFTLRQFARLAGAVAAHEGDRSLSGAELVRLVILARGHVAAVPPAKDDIEDPVGRSRRAMRRCEREIDAAVEAISRSLGSPTGSLCTPYHLN